MGRSRGWGRGSNLCSLVCLLIRTLIPSDQDRTYKTSLTLITFLKALTPNAVILGVQASTFEFEGAQFISQYHFCYGKAIMLLCS